MSLPSFFLLCPLIWALPPCRSILGNKTVTKHTTDAYWNLLDRACPASLIALVPPPITLLPLTCRRGRRRRRRRRRLYRYTRLQALDLQLVRKEKVLGGSEPLPLSRPAGQTASRRARSQDLDIRAWLLPPTGEWNLCVCVCVCARARDCHQPARENRRPASQG